MRFAIFRPAFHVNELCTAFSSLRDWRAMSKRPPVSELSAECRAMLSC